MLRRILKPWFVWRPRQIALRILRAAKAVPSGYRSLHTAWGATIAADPSKTIGHSIWTTGVYDLSVSEALARLIRPGDLVVDAGANIGYMSVLAAAATGPTGHVLSFEPNPDLFHVLERNIGSRLDNYAPIQAYGIALGASGGTAELVLPSEMSANDGLAFIGRSTTAKDRRVQVAISTLDEILADRFVGVLKLDVEGYEIEVLRGASRALSEGRIRDIVFEDHQGQDSEVCRFVRRHEYAVYSISWDLGGLRIEDLDRGKRSADYEAQSFLATRTPRRSLPLGNRRGWRVLKKM